MQPEYQRPIDRVGVDGARVCGRDRCLYVIFRNLIARDGLIELAEAETD